MSVLAPARGQEYGIVTVDVAVEALRVAAASSGQVTEVVRYPEAEHGFNCDQRASYHESSAKNAWQLTLAWFAAHLHR